MKLRVTEITEDPTVQLRDGLDMDRVAAMIEFEEQGGHLPPITVVGEDNLLADGHHRLYVAHKMGRVDIEAERVPGGKPEAIAVAIARNDIATTKPLTREQRNQGIKQLLSAGWSTRKIAKITGQHSTTVLNIQQGFKVREQLPAEVNDRLGDTVTYRIATVKPEQQVEFAAAVAEAELSEPRVREAIKVLASNGLSPTEAVHEVAPRGQPMPTAMFEVAKRVRRRLDAFLDETMLIDGVERDFWDVLEVIARNTERVDEPSLRGLSHRLAEISVKADSYAGRLSVDEAVTA